MARTSWGAERWWVGALAAAWLCGCECGTASTPVSPNPITETTADPQPRPASGTISSGKFELRYKIEGTGAPAIVVGFPEIYARAFSQNLRKNLRLVFADHRVSASSPGETDKTQFTLEAIVDDIELVRRELGLEKIAIIGVSAHVLMALAYAQKYPERVSHVILVALVPPADSETKERYWDKWASPERKAALEAMQKRVAVQDLEAIPPGRRFAEFLLRLAPLSWYDPNYDDSALLEGVEIDFGMFQYVWFDVLVKAGWPDLDSMKLPVFVALGRYDFLQCPPSAWDPILSKYKNVTVRVFERSGHYPYLEEPDAFDTALLSWMRKHE